MAHTPTLKQLKYLCAVAEHRHFGKAAKACFVSQSTLSSGIHELEEILGVSLLEREQKRVRLTAVGKDITDRAIGIRAATEDLVAAASAAHEPFTTFVLPKMLKHLRKKYPQFKLYIREDLSGHLVKELQAGELDLLLLALPYPADNITEEHLFYDEFLLAYEKNNNLAKKKKLVTDDLIDQDLLLLEDGHCLRDHAMAACKIQTQDVRIAYQATSLSTIIQMVANDIGITILPKMAIESKILQGTSVAIKEFDDDKIWRSIGLMWRKKSPRQNEFKQLGELICEVQKKFKNK
jgi:LysR family hydrogen peroxide-inducible transcriptional activator